MPFYGEPWVEEGNVEQAIPTMDAILARNPRHVLHGHYGLTFMYPKDAIRVFRDAYAWLTDTTRRLVLAGYSAKEIWRLNLVPPGLEDHSEAFLAYLTPRNHIIARIADNLTGIWQEDSTGKEPAGLDALTAVEYGRLLDKYLALSAADVADMLGRILDGGDNELALKLATAAQARYPGSEDIVAHADIAADRLRSINQFIDPFKFVVYAELRGKEHKSIAARAPEDAGRVEDTAR